MTFFEVAGAQRACRAFTDEPVDDGDLTRILEAATWAPSAENQQPWVFVVVTDADARAAIAGIVERAWEQFGAEHARAHLDDLAFAAVDAGARSGIGGAPVLVVVAADTTLVPRVSLSSSIFPAVQNLLLAANALGYGSALTTLALAYADELAGVVELPEGIRPMAVVPIGRPATRLGPPRRLPVADKAHRDRYGTGW